MGKRGKRNRKSRFQRSEYDVFLVYVDGETEQWYLKNVVQKFLDRNFLDIKIRVCPDIPKKGKSYREKIKDLQIKSKLATACYYLVDFDDIRHKNDIKKFNFLKQKKEGINKVRILFNNPCLEFWFLLHFKGDTTKQFADCNEAISDLNRFLNFKYDKNKLVFSNRFCQLLLKMYSIDFINKLISNAMAKGTIERWDERDKSVAEIYVILADILELAKRKKDQ